MKFKKERERKKKENSTELQKPNIETEVYNNNKKCDQEKKEKKKLKSLIRFHSANEIDSYNRAGMSRARSPQILNVHGRHPPCTSGTG